jgi:hypothetical protein
MADTPIVDASPTEPVGEWPLTAIPTAPLSIGRLPTASSAMAIPSSPCCPIPSAIACGESGLVDGVFTKLAFLECWMLPWTIEACLWWPYEPEPEGFRSMGAATSWVVVSFGTEATGVRGRGEAPRPEAVVRALPRTKDGSRECNDANDGVGVTARISAAW